MRLLPPVLLAAVLLSTCALGAPLAAQNLLKHDAWTKVNPEFVRDLKVTPTQISFTPFDPKQSYTLAGIEQVVEIPAAGTYSLCVPCLSAAHTGYSPVEIEFAGTEYLNCYSFFVRVPRRFDKPQKVTIRITVGVIRFKEELCVFEQPTLRRVEEPAIRIWFKDLYADGGNSADVLVSTEAHLVFLSLGKLPVPVTIPGAGHVQIDPSLMVLAGWSSEPQPKIKLDFWRILFNSRGNYWGLPKPPPLYFQAVDLVTGRIGSMASVDYSRVWWW